MEQDFVDATLELLDEENRAADLVLWVGTVVVDALKREGAITLFVQDETNNHSLPIHMRKRFIRIAPLTQVHIDAAALTDTEPYKVKKYVRPIRASGRPQFVARRGGELWEVELERDEGSEAD